jgi:hypothetical protein
MLRQNQNLGQLHKHDIQLGGGSLSIGVDGVSNLGLRRQAATWARAR